MLSHSVLRITTKDLDEISTALEVQTKKARGLLSQMPVILDFEVNEINVDSLLELLREHDLTVLAAYRCAASLEQRARQAGLPVILAPAGRRGNGRTVIEDEPAETAAEPASAPPEEIKPNGGNGAEAPDAPRHAEKRIIRTPVRSGQQIYARGDLTVLSSVSPGAEVIADGCIHVYGSLRGRAVAGAQGDESARIFCHNLQAELLAVAGRYKVADDIAEPMRGQAVQIYLDGDRMCIDSLN